MSDNGERYRPGWQACYAETTIRSMPKPYKEGDLVRVRGREEGFKLGVYLGAWGMWSAYDKADRWITVWPGDILGRAPSPMAEPKPFKPGDQVTYDNGQGSKVLCTVLGKDGYLELNPGVRRTWLDHCEKVGRMFLRIDRRLSGYPGNGTTIIAQRRFVDWDDFDHDPDLDVRCAGCERMAEVCEGEACPRCGWNMDLEHGEAVWTCSRACRSAYVSSKSREECPGCGGSGCLEGTNACHCRPEPAKEPPVEETTVDARCWCGGERLHSGLKGGDVCVADLSHDVDGADPDRSIRPWPEDEDFVLLYRRRGGG